jgi:hypothetical protein
MAFLKITYNSNSQRPCVIIILIVVEVLMETLLTTSMLLPNSVRRLIARIRNKILWILLSGFNVKIKNRNVSKT